MRISQLAVESGVPVATIKFYIREKLLHEGELTSPTQATYGESHVQRLGLIRALLGPGGLSVAATEQLLHQIDHPPGSTHELLGVAHHAVQRPVRDDRNLEGVRRLLNGWGWHIDAKDSETHAALADALEGLDAAGFELPDGALELYARQMHAIAEAEIAAVPTDSAEAAVRYVVLGTVLVEPLLLALRRAAQQDASRRRFPLRNGVRLGGPPQGEDLWALGLAPPQHEGDQDGDLDDR